MISSAQVDNKKKDILILGIGATQGLEHTVTAEKIYSVSFTVTKRTFSLSLHYNGTNSYLFVNGKDSAIARTPLCLGNISEDWLVNNIKKNWTKWICLLLLNIVALIQ